MRTRFSYRCLWVFNNSEPAKNWNQWEGSTWWRTHKKLCSSMIISGYQGGNTRHKIKVKVGLVYWSIEDNCFNLSEKWDQRRTIMVGTTVAKGQILVIRWTYTKGIIYLREAFNDKIYIVSMGMNTSSRSTPTSPMHNISFTSHVRWSCSVEILSSEAPEEYDSWKLSGSHGLEKAYVQPIGAS